MILTMELWDERKRVIWKAISQHEVSKERHATNQRSYRDVVINDNKEAKLRSEEHNQKLQHSSKSVIWREEAQDTALKKK
jgi:hypothetical protein